MSFRFDIPGVLWVPGKLLRGRLINGDTMANAAEQALTETPLAGGISLYSGTSSIANPTDSIAAPYFRQVRQVTAQTTVSFDDTATAQGVIPPTEFAYLSGGYALPELPAGAVQALTGQTNVISTLFINNKLFIRADVEAIAANTSAASVTGNLMNVNASSGGLGIGDILVTQNQGGVGNLKPTIASIGQPNVTVSAYLQSDFTAGNRTLAYVKDQKITNSSGDWPSEMHLAAGTYAFTFDDNRASYPAVQNVVVS